LMINVNYLDDAAAVDDASNQALGQQIRRSWRRWVWVSA